jgi:hypothetical protein
MIQTERVLAIIAVPLAGVLISQIVIGVMGFSILRLVRLLPRALSH